MVYDTASVIVILVYNGLVVLCIAMGRERHLPFIKFFALIGWFVLTALTAHAAGRIEGLEEAERECSNHGSIPGKVHAANFRARIQELKGVVS